VAGKLRRLDAHRDTAEAELRAPLLLDHTPPVPVLLDAAALDEASALFDAIATPAPTRAPAPVAASASAGASPAAVTKAPPADRPYFGDDVEKVLWLQAHPGRATAEDRAWLRDAAHSPAFRFELEMNGVDAATLSTLTRQPASEAA